MSQTSSSNLCAFEELCPYGYEVGPYTQIPYYGQAMGHPCVYFAQVQPSKNKHTERICKYCNEDTCFVNAYKWYNEERKMSIVPGKPDAGFATWLESKYKEYQQHTDCLGTTSRVTQSTINDENNRKIKDCNPSSCYAKRFSRLRSPWRKRRKSKVTEIALGDQRKPSSCSFEFILKPKTLTRRASDCADHSTAINRKSSALSSDCPANVKKEDKTDSVASVFMSTPKPKENIKNNELNTLEITSAEHLKKVTDMYENTNRSPSNHKKIIDINGKNIPSTTGDKSDPAECVCPIHNGKDTEIHTLKTNLSVLKKDSMGNDLKSIHATSKQAKIDLNSPIAPKKSMDDISNCGKAFDKRNGNKALNNVEVKRKLVECQCSLYNKTKREEESSETNLVNNTKSIPTAENQINIPDTTVKNVPRISLIDQIDSTKCQCKLVSLEENKPGTEKRDSFINKLKRDSLGNDIKMYTFSSTNKVNFPNEIVEISSSQVGMAKSEECQCPSEVQTISMKDDICQTSFFQQCCRCAKPALTHKQCNQQTSDISITLVQNTCPCPHRVLLMKVFYVDQHNAKNV